MLRKELEDIKVEESQMDGDLAKRKNWLRERKISIMRKLGQKVNQGNIDMNANIEWRCDFAKRPSVSVKLVLVLASWQIWVLVSQGINKLHFVVCLLCILIVLFLRR